MKTFFIVSLITLTFILGCPSGPPNITDSQYCAPAENNLKALCNKDPVANKLCCETVKPTLKGKSFTQFCQETEANGIELAPKCLSTITSCSQLDICRLQGI